MTALEKIGRGKRTATKAQPAYRQILETLRTRIRDGSYPVGDRLPTDEALMSEFGVSRHTARAAVQVLVDDDVVRRFRRKGSFVLATPETSGQWALNSLEDLIEHSFAHKVRVRGKGLIPAAEAPEAAKVLRLAAKSPVFRLVVVREGNEAPYTYSEIYIPAGIAEWIPARSLSGVLSGAVIRMIETHSGIPAVRAVQVASAAAARADIARELDVPEGTPLLLLERTYTSRDGQVLQFARVFCRSDRYRQTVEFRRNQAGVTEEKRLSGAANKRHRGQGSNP